MKKLLRSLAALSVFSVIVGSSIPAHAAIIQTGTLRGRVQMLPLCPPRSSVIHCNIRINSSGRKIVIYSMDLKTIVAEKRLSSSGFYSLRLPHGNYMVVVSPPGVNQDTPRHIMILPKETTKLNFTVDSGINLNTLVH